MGKNSVIKTLGKRIGNVVLHTLLVKHTNRPESISHLYKEEIAYRDEAIKESKKYNWNEQDRQILRAQAKEFIKSKKEQKYKDILFTSDEAERLVDMEIKNLGL